MRKFVFLSIIVILSSVCASCSTTSNNTADPTIATVSATNTPGVTMKDAGSTTNTTTPTYVHKTPTDLLYNVTSIGEAQKKGLRVVEDQSFPVELNNWGKVRFVSGRIDIDGLFKSCYFLTNDNGSIVYMFPDFYGNAWSNAYSIDAVSFSDLNKDGLKDIIVIASYMTGVGSTGAVPFPVCGIYFQKDREFLRLPSLEEEINRAGKSQNISMVLEFLKGKEITIAKNNPTPSANIQSSAMEAYKSVLQNKDRFFSPEDQKNKYLNDFLAAGGSGFERKLEVTHFTMLDLDGDKIPEIVLELSVAGNEYPDFYEVLHYTNSTVYGYIQVYRGFSELKADGTFSYSSSASNWGFAKLRFTANTVERDELGYCEPSGNKQTPLYFIHHKPVTEESFSTFVKEQQKKKAVTWHEFTQKNIETELSIRP